MGDNSKYIHNFVSLVDSITANLKDEIQDMAKGIGQVMKDEGIIQLFGWQQDQTLPMELGYRAGGLIQYHRIDVKDLALRKIISNEEYLDDSIKNRTDLVPHIFEVYNIDKRDGFLITQISALAPFNDAFVKEIKVRGHKLFLITNSKFPLATETLAYQEADLIIDLNLAYPDNAIELSNGMKIGATSNLLGNVVAQMLTAEIYSYLKSIGENSGVLLSANIKGADEHNRILGLKYDGRYNSW